MRQAHNHNRNSKYSWADLDRTTTTSDECSTPFLATAVITGDMASAITGEEYAGHTASRTAKPSITLL